MSHNKPECRILHVFTALGVGGAETWLIALLKYFKNIEHELPIRLKFDICLTGGLKADLDEEAEALGGRLFYLSYTRRELPAFIRKFRSILKRGRYHVVHDHQDYTAGLHFLFGLGCLPLVRVVHVHNAMIHFDNYSTSPLRRMTVKTGRQLVARLATDILGTSRQVLAEYGFQESQLKSVQLKTVHCGFDVARFFEGDRAALRADVRAEFGWPQSAKILLFVGRLAARQKNPEFAMKVAQNCITRDLSVRLLMVGAGDERKELSMLVQEWRLEREICFAGVRSDVPRLMQAADLLLFPSVAEGLGMVAVEAQASGLRVLASETVPRECAVSPDLVRFKSLDESASAWSRSALEWMSEPSPDAAESNRRVHESAFSIQRSASRLLEVYGVNVAGRTSAPR